jgi:hypothetical protein
VVRVPKTPTKYDSQGVDSARREQAVLWVQKTGVFEAAIFGAHLISLSFSVKSQTIRPPSTRTGAPNFDQSLDRPRGRGCRHRDWKLVSETCRCRLDEWPLISYRVGADFVSELSKSSVFS